MRRVALLITLVLVVSTPLAGQTMLALKAGVGSSSLATDEAGVGVSERYGIVAGAELGFVLTPALGLRFGGMFAEKGSSVSFELEDVSLSARTELQYVQGLALVRLGTPIRPEGVDFGLLVGSWAGYLLSCSASVEGEAEGTCDGVESTDYGIAAGFGLEVGIRGAPRLAVDLLWAPGLSGIDADGTNTRHAFVQAGIAVPIG